MKRVIISGIFMVLMALAILTQTTPIVGQEVTSLDAGLYTEDFSSYSYKDYVKNTVWDIGGNSLRLARSDSIDQTKPAIAVDPNGNTIVVWHSVRSTADYTDIYAQKFDTNGNNLWVTDIKINTVYSQPMVYYPPAVALDANGNAIIVWTVFGYNIYAQRIDPDGNKLWATDVQVDSGSGTYLGGPDVTIDGNGNAIVVWQDDRDNNSDIYAQKLDSIGNKLWGADLRVNSDIGTAIQAYPSVAIDSNQNIVVVWVDNRNEDGANLGFYTRLDIYTQKLDANGNKLWMQDVKVNSDINSDWAYPSIEVDPNGNAFVIWSHYDSFWWYIYAQKLSPDGIKLWTDDVHVDSNSSNYNYADSPDIAVDPNGHVIAVWTDRRNGNREVFLQKLDTNGTKIWTDNINLEPANQTIQQWFPKIAIDQDGNALVARRDYLPGSGDIDVGFYGSGDIYLQKVDPNGNELWGADVRANTDSGMAGQIRSGIAVDQNGQAVIVWQDTRNNNSDIYAQKTDSDGGFLWAENGIRVNSDHETANQISPAVAIDENGNIVVVWMDERNNQWDIFAQKLGPNGNKLWPSDVHVNGNRGVFARYYDVISVAIDTTGDAVIVWCAADIYAQKLDEDGNRVWVNDIRISSGSGTSIAPTVALDANQNALVAWTDTDISVQKFDIYVQKLDINGNRLWNADVIANTTTQSDYEGASPEIIADKNENAIVVWKSLHDSSDDGDIYAQKLNTDGNIVWAADVRVNSDSGPGGQSHPDVAVDSSGQTVIVWEDRRNFYYDEIYVQKLNSNGGRVWPTEIRVGSDIGIANRQQPSVALDAGDDAFIVWEDTRNNNWDIFAQKVNAGGNKSWLTDLQVVYPDQFYFTSGTAQSRTVDTTAENISEATLTANYALNGGDIVFSLTNDGGQHWTTAIPGVTHVFTTTGSDLRWRANLSADPLWRHRSPTVSSLRLDYVFASNNGDPYEMDDTCVQAQAIAVNGAAQDHTFHQYQDFDWVWFEATAGVEYVIQATHLGDLADLELELYSACGQSPDQTDDNAFGEDVRLTFSALADGVHYVKVLNHTPGDYGDNTAYQLSVRTHTPAPLVTIITGRNDADELSSNIANMGDRAYRTFRRAGVPRENIRYLAFGSNRDVDQDGYLDIAASPTWSNARYAIQDWPRERGLGLGVPFYLYLVDHGGTDYYCVEGCTTDERISAKNLNLWLSNLEATTGADEVNVIIEACYSGSFIDQTAYGAAEISGRNRVVIASTGSNRRAFPSLQGGYFSDAFFTWLGDNADLWTAYEKGRAVVAISATEQTPWLDDNGDAVADGSDGQLARGRGLVAFGGGSIPVVDWLVVSDDLIKAQVRDDVVVLTATVEIYPPDLVIPDTGEGETPELPVERVVLIDADHDGVYEGHYTFNQQGSYQLVAYAWDNDGNLSLPVAANTGDKKVYLPVVVKN